MSTDLERPCEAAQRVSDLITADGERRAAVFMLKNLYSMTNWNAFYANEYEPSEEDIALVIKKIRENPFLVPSYDPDDP